MKGHWGWLGEQGCGGSDDCAMAFPWMNVAILSAAAVRGFARALDARALAAQCAHFKMTHDAGLGLLAWMHATPIVLLGGYGGAPKFMDSKPPASAAAARALVGAHGLRRRAGAATLGGLEGVSYLVLLGLVGKSIALKVRTGTGLPAGPYGLIGALEGVAYLEIVGLVVSQVLKATKGV